MDTIKEAFQTNSLCYFLYTDLPCYTQRKRFEKIRSVFIKKYEY